MERSERTFLVVDDFFPPDFAPPWISSSLLSSSTAPARWSLPPEARGSEPEEELCGGVERGEE